MLSRRYARIWLATAVLLIMFALAVGSMAQKAPTFDEQGFLVRGLAYVRGQRHIRVGHPAGLNALNALFLANDESVKLPLDDPSWQNTSFHRPAELFLWEIGNDVAHVMFVARMPSIWLGLLLAALVSRWAWMLSRRSWAGLLALCLIAFDPNILAHMRLTTTDLGLTFGVVLAAFTLWWFLKRPLLPNAILAGAGFGLLQNTKFTAGLFVPLFVLVIFVGLFGYWHQLPPHKNKRRPFGRVLLLLLIVYPLAAFLTLWLAYGFEIDTLPQSLPTFSQLSGMTLPLAHHLEQLLDIGGRLQIGTPAFLLGQHTDSGWWYYFPVAFLLKTPLPTLILLLWAIVVTAVYTIQRLRHRSVTRLTQNVASLTALDFAALLIPAIGFFAFAITTDINLGYRHILPVLPFLIVFTAVSLPSVYISFPDNKSFPNIISRACAELAEVSAEESRSPSHTSKSLNKANPATLLVCLLLVITIWIYPDYLAYFNLIAGGPSGGWRYLVDSNLDWGQDLDDLPGWMSANDVEEVWLSYFGEARPEYYGICYTGLDSFPPRLMNSQTRPFRPDNPAPGIYAISATNLQGVQFADHDTFAWFKEREPIDKLGYSIFLYDVPSSGESTALLLDGIQVDEMDGAEYAQLESNDVVPRWVDLTQALLLPENDRVWLATDGEQSPHPLFENYLSGWNMAVSSPNIGPITLERPFLPEDPMAIFEQDDGQIALWDAQVVAVDEDGLTLLSIWEQQGEQRPLKLFIHAIGPDGQLATQWDGLGAAWEGWRQDDILLQVHTFPWPDDPLAGEYSLSTGIYHPSSLQRWQTTEGMDSQLIGRVSFPR